MNEVKNKNLAREKSDNGFTLKTQNLSPKGWFFWTLWFWPTLLALLYFLGLSFEQYFGLKDVYLYSFFGFFYISALTSSFLKWNINR
ncbi:MAG: hypothetical protein HN576_13405 [Bacteriovoracaceae bacterium]|jgi:hypothetical protein|nr:hypothetical protein [Bacteriovoracaceae bacterium]